MDPAACARAKKGARLAREAAEKTPEPQPLPLTPEEAAERARREYRRHTRPYRRAFRGIISRRDAERFVIARLNRTNRAVAAGVEAANKEAIGDNPCVSI